MSQCEIRIYPKLFIGAASDAFIRYMQKNNIHYNINYITDRDDLIHIIEVYSGYKNYKPPVIISDISYLSQSDQSLLLKFMDDTDLKIILLASRDNILDTIVSRVREFRKYYITKDSIGFFQPSKAREMLNNEIGDNTEMSYDDKLKLYNKYNSLLGYNDYITRMFNLNDRKKLLSLLES